MDVVQNVLFSEEQLIQENSKYIVLNENFFNPLDSDTQEILKFTLVSELFFFNLEGGKKLEGRTFCFLWKQIFIFHYNKNQVSDLVRSNNVE